MKRDEFSSKQTRDVSFDGVFLHMGYALIGMVSPLKNEDRERPGGQNDERYDKDEEHRDGNESTRENKE